MEKAYKIAAAAMLISGVTHASQLYVYGFEQDIIGAAIFGPIYFIIGLGLWKKMRSAFWAGATLPAVGLVMGTYRFFYIHMTPFSVFHVILDIIVIPICVYYLFKSTFWSGRTP